MLGVCVRAHTRAHGQLNFYSRDLHCTASFGGPAVFTRFLLLVLYSYYMSFIKRITPLLHLFLKQPHKLNGRHRLSSGLEKETQFNHYFPQNQIEVDQ